MPDARRRACLQAIGVDLWRLRPPIQGRAEAVSRSTEAGPRPNSEGVKEPDLSGQSAPAPSVSPGSDKAPGATDSPPTPPQGHDHPSLSEHPSSPGLQDDEPVADDFDDYAAFAAEPEPSVLNGVSKLDWPELETTVAGCTACGLHATRTQAVFGVGDRAADLMVIGEAPGADEDRKGEPFVGRAGQLLNAMLEAIGFARERVYIANIIKCRPPGNRDPHAEEVEACHRYLLRQIELVAPRAILSVGRVSAHNLLHTDQSLARLRGKTHRFGPQEILLRVTYHPAYLLRRPLEKAKAWQDLQAVHRLLHGEHG